jgi:conjugative relaxase-like TrwC/TraI family protein
VVGVTKIQRGNAGYWLSAVAEGGEDYYAKPGEEPGEWMGSLAEHLGLEGEVAPDAYWAILEGRDPGSESELLTRPPTSYRERPDGSLKRVEPVLGYDIRFSAPKSISLLYALGSSETQARIVEVMNQAVREGIAHLEHEACMVGRGQGGARIEPGQGFVGMGFRHRMSRAGDPALHVHVVISNLTRATSDGKWLSLVSPKGRSPLFPFGKSAGVVFQAALRAGFLREFGLEFAEVRNGYADLKGFPRALIEAFSTRSREIAEWMDKHGVSSVKAAQTAAYRTRDAKDYSVDADQRVEEWVAQAEPHGFGPETAEKMVRAGRPREPRAIEDSVLAEAVEALELSSSTFDRRALLWAVAEQLPEGADLDTLSRAVEEVLASDLVLCVHQSSGPLDLDAYTTPRIAEAEKTFIDSAIEGAGAGAGMVPNEGVEAVLARHSYLGADQREMVLRLTTGGEQVIAVAAWPGTGKTTALRACAEAWSEAGHLVIGCATARTATGELIDAGVRNSFSIRSLLYQVHRLHQEGKSLPEGTIIVVDETNFADTFALAELGAISRGCGGKLVVIGDPHQIGAIGPGGLYTHLTRTMEPVRLTTIRRQHRAEDRRIVKLIYERRGSEAVDLLRSEGKLVVGDDLTSTLHGLLNDWYRDFASGADAVMIARRNRDVDYLNDQAHELRHLAGELGQEEVIVGERPISVGEQVMTRINSREVDNRERFEVIGLDATARAVRLRRIGGDGREVTLTSGYLNLTTDQGAPALQYAYAITKFGAESKTFDRAYPLLDSGARLEEELVAMSRGREIANAYVVASSELLDPDLGPGRRELSDLLQDVRGAIEQRGSETLALDEAMRRRVDQLSPSELAERAVALTGGADRAEGGDPSVEAISETIATDRLWLARIAEQRAEAEKHAGSLPEEVEHLSALEAGTAERLRSNEARREQAAEMVIPSKAHEPAAVERRLESALIEERISREASREIAAARAGESEPIYKSLGPYPSDPRLAARWSDGAHAIATYRVRHNIHDRRSALGRRPDERTARVEYAQARDRIDSARRALRLERSQEQVAERSAVGDLGIEI